MQHSIRASILAISVASGAAAAPSATLSTGPFSAAPNADPVVAARAAIATWTSAELVPVVTTGSNGTDRVVRFQQMHEGVPVLFRGAGALVRDDGTTAWIIPRTETTFPSSKPSVSASRAADLARPAAGLATDASDARLAYFPFRGGLRLAWVVVPKARVPGLPWVPVVVVDAQSEERLASWNAVRFVNQAQVYPTNPVASPTLTDVTLPVDNGMTGLENARVKSLNCVDTKQVKSVNLMGFPLSVHICELQQKAVPDSNGDFLYAPASDTEPEDEFSEVSMFYHVNRAYDFFEAMGMTDLATKPLPTVSNLRIPAGMMTFDLTKMSDPNLPLVPFQNAFFAPANPIFSSVFGLPGAAMWFGQGPLRDYSYDGDVIYHEFTHAVVDHTLKLVGTWHADEQGLIDSPGAMNEALADYFSSAIAGDGLVGEYASKDLAPGLTAIRDLDNDYACPQWIAGEVHSDSQFWSAGLWKVRKGLAASDQSKMDKALLDVMIAAPGGDLGFDELTQLFADSVKAEVGQAAADAFGKEMGTRGASACARVLEYAGQPIDGNDPMLAKNLVAPGVSDAALGQIPFAPGVTQFHVPLTPAAVLTIQMAAKANPNGLSSMNPLQQQKPFAPKVLVKWGDAPLAFVYAPDFVSDADATLDLALSANQGNVSLDIPAGTTSAYVMLVNAGEEQGLYKSVEFQLSGDAPQADAGLDDAGVGGSSGSQRAPLGRLRALRAGPRRAASPPPSLNDPGGRGNRCPASLSEVE